MPPNDEIPLIPQPLFVRAPHLYFYDPTYKLDPDIEAEYFVYQFPEFPTITLVPQQQQVIIQSNTAFEMREILYYYNVADAQFTQATRPVPNITLQLQDSGSGKNMFNAPAPIATVASHGENRRRALNWTRIFSPNSTITATIQNFDVAVVTGNLFLTLIGRHLYRLAR
jgi:hypothetical protein